MPNELVNKSIIYSRVSSKFDKLLLALKKDAETDDDPSIQLMGYFVKAMSKACDDYANSLWLIAESRSSPNPDDFEDLANAIVLMSVSDYEKLISGSLAETTDHNFDEIKRFWDARSFIRPSMDMENVKERIDIAANQFRQIAKDHGKFIIRETEIARKSKRGNHDYRFDTSYRCPLCKGNLYAARRNGSPFYTIQCSGCDLTYTITDKNKKEVS